MRVRMWLLRCSLGVAAGFALIQLVPFGRTHTNPSVRKEPPWDAPKTRQLAETACFSCHSNETEWPWYSNVAPMSWLLQRDVNQGRAELNFSRWDIEQKEAEDAAETVAEGSMPPLRFLLAHPGARLDDTERRALIAGFHATLGRAEAD